MLESRLVLKQGKKARLCSEHFNPEQAQLCSNEQAEAVQQGDRKGFAGGGGGMGCV